MIVKRRHGYPRPTRSWCCQSEAESSKLSKVPHKQATGIGRLGPNSNDPDETEPICFEEGRHLLSSDVDGTHVILEHMKGHEANSVVLDWRGISSEKDKHGEVSIAWCSALILPERPIIGAQLGLIVELNRSASHWREGSWQHHKKATPERI